LNNSKEFPMSSIAVLDDLLTTLSTEQREAFIAEYSALRELPTARCELQAFFDSYLKHLVGLYAATAGALWFRSAESNDLTLKAQVGYERLGLDGELITAHQNLLRYALTRNKSFLVKPFSAPAKLAGVSNPTDSFIVLGPVDHHGERIAAVELFLGPTSGRGKTAAERNRYLLWLDHLLSFLCQGIQIRFLRKTAPLQTALDRISAAQVEMNALQRSIRETLERHLAVFAGWNFGSLEKNQSFANRVHELIDQYGLRVACLQCGSPAILRCQNSGNSKAGVFLFDHYLENGRTFHGGPTTVPQLKLVAKPARRKRETA
jgi:hypothetical protein